MVTTAEEAIWSQQPFVLERIAGLNRSSWAGAVQADLLRSGIEGALPQLLQAAAPYPDAAALMLVKDEEDIIFLNLDWLHYIGVRKFIICDNASSDLTVQHIERFRLARGDCEVLTISDPTVRYTQSLKTTAMMRFALSIWPELKWVLPIDADEFLVAQNGIGCLADVHPEIDAIIIPKVIHLRHRQALPPGTESPLARMGLRNPLFCVPPKAICRASLLMTIGPGNHQTPRLGGDEPSYGNGLELGLCYREFQTRSYEHFARKVVNGAAAIAAARRHTGRAEGGDHWLRWGEVLRTAGEAGLRRIYDAECVHEENGHFRMDPFLGRPAASAEARLAPAAQTPRPRRTARIG